VRVNTYKVVFKVGCLFINIRYAHFAIYRFFWIEKNSEYVHIAFFSIMKGYDMRSFSLALVTTGVLFSQAALANDGRTLKTDNDIKFYGFVRLDGTHDIGVSNTGSGGDWGSFLQTQPLDGTPASKKRGGTYLTARTSRFGFDGKLAGGAVGFKLEGDFNGTSSEEGQPGRSGSNSTGLRIRHAYVELQNWLVGQTWTNYEDLASSPETVQFNPSLTSSASRQAQIRYTWNLPASQLSLALENAGSAVLDSSSNKYDNNFDKSVDATIRWTKSGDWGHVSARAASVGYSTTSGATTHSARGYQVGLSGSSIVPTGKFVYGAFMGNGGGRYAWGSVLQGAVDKTSDISLFRSHAYHVGYTHNWSGTLRSNLAYAVMDFEDNQNAIAGMSNKRLAQTHINLISNVAKDTELGVEYAYGKRTSMLPVDSSGAKNGAEKRLNVALTTMF
jgi:DcaP outer membrane protein